MAYTEKDTTGIGFDDSDWSYGDPTGTYYGDSGAGDGRNLYGTPQQQYERALEAYNTDLRTMGGDEARRYRRDNPPPQPSDFGYDPTPDPTPAPTPPTPTPEPLPPPTPTPPDHDIVNNLVDENIVNVIKNPDGSRTEINPDGSYTTVDSDGTMTQVDSIGTVTVSEPSRFGEGAGTRTVTTTYADGTQLVENWDGTKSYTDDTSTTDYSADGSNNTTYHDGSSRVVDSGGNATHFDHNGDFVESVPGYTAEQYGLTYNEDMDAWGKPIDPDSVQGKMGGFLFGDSMVMFQPYEPDPETGEPRPISGPDHPNTSPGYTEDPDDPTGEYGGGDGTPPSEPPIDGGGGMSAEDIMSGIARDIWGRSKEQLEVLQPQWQRALQPDYDPKKTQEFGKLFDDINRGYQNEWDRSQQRILDLTKPGAAQDYTINEAKKQMTRDQQLQANTFAGDIAKRMRGEAYAVASGEPAKVLAGLSPLASTQGAAQRADIERMTQLYREAGSAFGDK
jgi:hypothetical protein